MKTITSTVQKIKDEIIKKQGHWNKRIEDYLRSLSQESRLTLIASMLLFMGFVFIGMMVATIIQLEKKSVRQIDFEHIRGLDLKSKPDTNNLNKNYDYGREN
ncbi:MAG: DUF3989 domain-containing protein [Clostridia bacterium]|nr:DUF3989 domain-containing protein [Clostridia bacterium]